MTVLRRRVQIAGGSTFIVSLPKEWARSIGLEKGSELLVSVLPDYSLRIMPPRRASRERRSISIVIEPSSIDTAIIEILSAYLAGYSVIKIVFRNLDLEEVRRIIMAARSKAIGLEVIEEKTGEFTLYSVIDTLSLPLSEALDKIVGTTRTMLEDVGGSIRRFREDVLKGVIERDEVVDKLFLLIMRQLNQLLLGEYTPSQLGFTSLAEALYMVVFIKSIERIADHAVLISENLLKMGERRASLTDQISVLFDKVKEAYINAVKGFRGRDKRYAAKVLALTREARSLEEEVRQSAASIAGFPELHLILDSIRRIIAYSIDIVESTINTALLREASAT